MMKKNDKWFVELKNNLWDIRKRLDLQNDTFVYSNDGCGDIQHVNDVSDET